MKLLLTGFEPFNGSSSNPSEQAARALDGQVIAGMEITCAILPVETGRGPQALLAALEARRPSAVLCLGEAPGRAALSVERVGLNLLDFRIPDNAGVSLIDQPVVPGGPAAYFVTLPTRAVRDAIRAAGVPAELSLSAGSYLCNQVLYCLLHHLAAQQRSIPAGFIHLPRLPEQAAGEEKFTATMSLDTMLTGLRSAVAVIASAASADAES